MRGRSCRSSRSTLPRVSGPSRRCSSVPLRPATAIACTSVERSAPSLQHWRRIATIACGVSRSSDERPEPSTILTPSSGTPFCSSTPDTTAAPSAVVPPVAGDRAELLEQELGREVVTVRVDRVQDLVERLRDRRREHLSARLERSRLAVDADVVLDQDRPELLGRRVRRGDRVRLPRPVAVDDERRERRRLLDVEGRLPPGRGADLVEEGLVADHHARHVCDAEPADPVGEHLEPGRRQRRVAVALQDEIAFPGAVRPERALAPHLGGEAEVRPERLQGREGDRQLLVRGGHEAHGLVVRVDQPAAREIDGDRARVASG